MADIRITDKNLVTSFLDTDVLVLERAGVPINTHRFTWLTLRTALQGAVLTGNTLWVDKVNGNNGTAIRGRLDKPFQTIGAAIAAAIAGDTVNVLASATPYDEHNLLKNGVNLFFFPGANVTYTGATAGAYIFDDAGATCVCRIVGWDFTYSGSGNGGVIKVLNSSSNVEFFGRTFVATTGSGSAILMDDADLVVRGTYIKHLGTGHAYEQLGGFGQLDMLNQISAVSGNAIKVEGAVEVFTPLISSTSGIGLRLGAGAVFVRVYDAKIKGSGTAISGEGTLSRMEIYNGRIVGKVNFTVQPSVRPVLSNCCIESAAPCVDADVPCEVRIYGGLVSNNDKDANITFTVGESKFEIDPQFGIS